MGWLCDMPPHQLLAMLPRLQVIHDLALIFQRSDALGTSADALAELLNSNAIPTYCIQEPEDVRDFLSCHSRSRDVVVCIPGLVAECRGNCLAEWCIQRVKGPADDSQAKKIKVDSNEEKKSLLAQLSQMKSQATAAASERDQFKWHYEAQQWITDQEVAGRLEAERKLEVQDTIVLETTSAVSVLCPVCGGVPFFG